MSDSLTGGIFCSERVRYFAEQCGHVFRRSALNLIHEALKLRNIDTNYMSVDEHKIRLYAIQSIKKWTQPIRNDESDSALREYSDMETNYKYAFVKYAQNYYGTDKYGNKVDLDLRIPPFTYFLFEYYTIASEYEDVLYEEFYKSNTYWKFTKQILRSTLRHVTNGRVFIQTGCDQEENTHSGQEISVYNKTSANHKNSLIVQQEVYPRIERSESYKDIRERRRDRHDRRDRDRKTHDMYERSRESPDHKKSNNESSGEKIITIDNIQVDSDPYRNVDSKHNTSDDDASERSSTSTN